MLTVQNESPTLAGRHATAQGAVAERKSTVIDNAVITESVTDEVSYLQKDGGKRYAEGLRDVARHIIFMAHKDSGSYDTRELVSYLMLLGDVEYTIANLAKTSEEEEVRHE